MSVVYLGLGSNLGDRLANLQVAVRLLARAGTVQKVSSLYETVAIGPEQALFYNAVCEIATELGPRELLAVTQAIQREMGRSAEGDRWGPRLIDIDILLYGRQVVEEDGLVIPHPEMLKRAFVLVPLSEIAPDVRHANGQTIASLSRAVGDEGVTKVADRGWERVEPGAKS